MQAFINRINSLLSQHQIIKVGSLWGAAGAYLVNQFYHTQPGPTLVATETSDTARAFTDDLNAFANSKNQFRTNSPLLILPQQSGDNKCIVFVPPLKRDNVAVRRCIPTATNPDAGGGAVAPIAAALGLAERIINLKRLKSAKRELIVVCPIALLDQNMPLPEALSEKVIAIKQHQQLNLEGFTRQLSENGFNRLDEVELPGEFSVRGGIVDVYPYDSPLPIRIEWLGNYIESIRQFDANTQETLAHLSHTEITLINPTQMPNPNNFSPDDPTLLDYLPADTLLYLAVSPARIPPCGTCSGGDLPHTTSDRLKKYRQIHLSVLPAGNDPAEVNLNIHSLEKLSGNLVNPLGELTALAARGTRIKVFCKDLIQKKSLSRLTTGHKPPLKPDIQANGIISQGFYFGEIDTAFVSYHEVFRESPCGGAHLPENKPSAAEAVMGKHSDMAEGDFVVHFVHGIGRYRGIRKIKKGDGVDDFMVIEYQDKALLYVPLNQTGMVHKYIGSRGFGGRATPELEKLGGRRWELKKERARNAIARLASELISIQATRARERGNSYINDTDLELDFETSFQYEDTPDQATVTDEVKRDMVSHRPMDRLICGDVGYGKTEIAIRAAFKAAMSNKQIAVLAPTTILAQQHYQNFLERMKSYPVVIDIISRFKPPAEQQKTLKRLAEGKVDIIIGTHRLLQNDVRFKDLGLAIIDEEHRFGVEHKEHFKHLRTMVDVLTLTATPIPRTLNMALSGLKGISTLTTPPLGRQAIETIVCRFSPEIIGKAISRELARQGQVFFVHNRVMDIERVAERLQAMVPGIRITIAHGQLPSKELESRMMEFITGKSNVLVCTNIIGSGVDIQRANTILINNAHDFGLSDLHQLRGRVGRYKEQAFAYFIIPPEEVIPEDAYKRLKAIEEFNELGAGFKIALRDMELRGVGNILGKEQHGHISAIGYHLYITLLEQEIRARTKKSR